MNCLKVNATDDLLWVVAVLGDLAHEGKIGREELVSAVESLDYDNVTE